MAQDGRAAGRPARRCLGTPGPARRPHGARTGPGHCRPHPATTRPRAAGRTVPSWTAGPSCRSRPGRRPAPALVPHLRPAAPPAAGGARNLAVRARAVWWPAACPARPRPPSRRPPRAVDPLPVRSPRPAIRLVVAVQLIMVTEVRRITTLITPCGEPQGRGRDRRRRGVHASRPSVSTPPAGQPRQQIQLGRARRAGRHLVTSAASTGVREAS